jgi:hypothetical protein
VRGRAIAAAAKRRVSAAGVRHRAIAAFAATLGAVALGACGTPSPDLFIVQREGTVPGARFNLLVSDTSVRCNHAKAVPLTSAQTIEARDILKDLQDVQSGAVKVPKSPPSQIFSYTITDEQGMLRFADTAQQPSVLPRLSLFVRRIAIGTCKLTR